MLHTAITPYDLITHICMWFFIGTALCFEVAVIWYKISSATRHHRDTLRQNYVEQVAKMSLAEEFHAPYPEVSSRQRQMALAEAIYLVLSHTYGTNPAPIKELVESTNLDIFLLKHISRHRGSARTRLLTIMNAIPSYRPLTPHLQPLLHSRRHDTRIAALLATLAAAPTTAIETIASLRYNLRPFDIARIILLLRRGIVPIAYDPLLSSNNRNLKMLGLAIVRNFGIEIADKQLQYIVATEADAGVVREAIYTLSSLGRSLGRTKIRSRLDAMSPPRRRELCRHLAREGYSLNALRSLFSSEETRDSEMLINSYKRSLECSI